MKLKALIIVDVQNDFCPGGALAVPQGDQIIPYINSIAPHFERVVASQDWHPLNHISFAQTHNKPAYQVISLGEIKQTLWPVHCVPGTAGAEFHQDLNVKEIDLIIRKGTNPAVDSYSVFLENDKTTETGLHYFLRGLKIQHLYFCGLATDYCVYFSCLDAVRFGFKTYLIKEATKGIDIPSGSLERALQDMKKKGVEIVSYESL